MKVLKITTVLALFLFITKGIAQTKEESINWLKGNLPNVLKLNPKFYNNLEILSVDECEIIVAYKDRKSNSYIVNYATRDIDVGSSKSRKSLAYNDIDGALRRKNGALEHYFVELLQIQDDYLDLVLKHIDKLSTFCRNKETLAWKDGDDKEAIKWLESIFKKYAYTADSDYVNPQVQLINNCKIVFSCDYYEEGDTDYEKSAELGIEVKKSEKLGTVTETIYMDTNAIAADDNCLRSESKEIFHKYSHDKDKIYAESYRSVVGIKKAYPELHDNVLKTMRFLNQNCKCGFICRLTEITNN